MGFENFGLVTSGTESKAARFLEYLEQGKIMGTACQRCGKKYSPPQMDCSRCLSDNMSWFEIAPECKLFSFTTVRYGPAGFENKAPYTIAIGEFSDSLRMLGHLSKDIPANEIKIGMKLKAVPVKLEGNRISYEFQKG